MEFIFLKIEIINIEIRIYNALKKLFRMKQISIEAYLYNFLFFFAHFFF